MLEEEAKGEAQWAVVREKLEQEREVRVRLVVPDAIVLCASGRYGCGGLLGSFCWWCCAKNFALALSGFFQRLLSVETFVFLGLDSTKKRSPLCLMWSSFQTFRERYLSARTHTPRYPPTRKEYRCLHGFRSSHFSLFCLFLPHRAAMSQTSDPL